MTNAFMVRYGVELYILEKKIHDHGEGAQNAIERREPPPGHGG
jgi:hypothetical protein